MPNGALFTSENAAEMGKRGGIASGEARRKRKTVRECFQAVETLAASKEAAAELLAHYPELENEELTVGMLAALQQIHAAAYEGDINAAKLFLQVDSETSGTMQAREDDAFSASLKQLAAEMEAQASGDV